MERRRRLDAATPAEAPRATAEDVKNAIIRDSVHRELRPWDPWSMNTPWVIMTVLALIVLGDISRIFGDILTPGGVTYALNDVVGPMATFSSDAWIAWGDSEFPIDRLLYAHVGMDAIFIAGYSVLIWRLGKGSRALRGELLVLIGIECVEAVILLIGAANGLHVPQGWVVAEVIVATLKWATVLTMVVTAIVDQTIRARIRSGLTRAAKALYRQRLMFVVVALFAVIAIAPATEIFEQLPDVQRAWLSSHGATVIDWFAIGWATLAYVVMARSIHIIARVRAARAFERAAGLVTDREPAVLLAWLIPVGAVLVIGGGLWLWSGGRLLDARPFWAFLIVISALVGISAFLRFVVGTRLKSLTVDHLAVVDKAAALDVRAAGDALVIAFVALAFLALAKAYASPALLAPQFLNQPNVTPATVFSIIAMCVGFFVAVVLSVVVPLAVLYRMRVSDSRVLRAAEANYPDLPRGTKRTASALKGADTEYLMQAVIGLGDRTRRRRALIISVVIAGAVILAALLVPRAFAEIGVVAVAISLIGSWAVLIAALSMWMSNNRPLEVFQALRLGSDPLLTLLIVVPVIVGLSGGAPGFHAIQADRDPVPAGVPWPGDTRPELGEAFEHWRENTACALPAGADGVLLRPLLLIAAEGGGARAATWTVDVLRELAIGDCSSSAALLSSGVSGGSAGLTSLRLERELEEGDPVPAVDDLTTRTARGVSNPSVLSNAVTAMLGRDLIAAVTGIRIPDSVDLSTGWPTPGPWLDRAAAIEAVWADRAQPLADSWDYEPTPVVGYTVLNSTAAVVDCKVILSQIDFTPGNPTKLFPLRDKPVQCSGSSAALPGTIDLVDFSADCPVQITWATATMNSARFPFVTPAGRISGRTADAPPCSSLRDLQLIDGGYADNTGLGTLETITPDLMALVREYNATAEARSEGYVVPIVLYVSNDYRSNTEPPPGQLESELSIPLNSFGGARDAQLLAEVRLDRLSGIIEHTCVSRDACATAVEAALEWAPGGIVLVTPTVEPFIQVPLGWTLSAISASQYNREVSQQMTEFEPGTATCISPPEGRRPLHENYGTLGELLCLLEPGLAGAYR